MTSPFQPPSDSNVPPMESFESWDIALSAKLRKLLHLEPRTTRTIVKWRDRLQERSILQRIHPAWWETECLFARALDDHKFLSVNLLLFCRAKICMGYHDDPIWKFSFKEEW
jgi:hypothetical protein